MSNNTKCARCGIGDQYVVDVGTGNAYHQDKRGCIDALKEECNRLRSALASESAKRADLERRLSASPNAIDSTLDSLDSRRQEACWNAYKETVARLTNGGSQREDIDTLLACLEDGGYLEIQQEIALIAIRKEADSLREQNAKLAEAAKAAAVQCIEASDAVRGLGREYPRLLRLATDLEVCAADLRAAIAEPAIQPKEPDHECD
jgi:hypothetical protein